MIRKLRIKLTAVSMISLSLVLVIIMGAVNILNYRKILSDADEILAILKENGGTFPKKSMFYEPFITDKKGVSPELPYESRYFSVLLSENGNVISVDTSKIAAVDTETALNFARRVWDSGRTSGFAGSYRYIRSDEGGETRVIFLDCGRSLSTFRNFLLASGAISAAGLLFVFILIILLSSRIVRPVSESYEKQKQFITDAGHELKTPLTIIDADAEVLEMEQGENEWLSDIKSQTKRLAALTNNLILLSRMEEDNPGLAMIEFPFSDLAAETAQSFQAPAIAQGKSFSADIQPMLSVRGDEKMLRQLISVLLDNALKYSAENGSVFVSLTQQKQQGTVCLAVENTVESDSRENLAHMFDRFYRGDKSRSSQSGGYGLGLSIAKAIAEAHKGKISACLKGDNLLRIQVVLPV